MPSDAVACSVLLYPLTRAQTDDLIASKGLQRGISVVSKSKTPSRIIANIELFDWEISDEDMKSFAKLNCGWRHLLWAETSNHPDYPFFDELPTGYKLEKAPTITSSGN